MIDMFKSMSLQENWEDECTDFFSNYHLCVKELTQIKFNENKSLDTIWLWWLSKSEDQNICNILLNHNIQILVIIVDESHQYFYNSSSQWCKNIFLIFFKSEMIIHINETLFFLRSKIDSNEIMKMLKNHWHKKSTFLFKWHDCKLNKQLQNLYKSQENQTVNWSVKKFCHIIIFFHL
jgi:hypothetical protein